MITDDVITFLMSTAVMLGVLLLYVFVKSGSSREGFKEYWEHSEGKDKPIWKSILFILGIPLLVGILFTAFYKDANSAEIKWFDHSSVFVGLDYTQHANPFCERDGHSDRISSNMGFKQNIFIKGNVALNAKYTHHSCAINPDSDNAYDAVGLVIEWKIN